MDNPKVNPYKPINNPGTKHWEIERSISTRLSKIVETFGLLILATFTIVWVFAELYFTARAGVAARYSLILLSVPIVIAFFTLPFIRNRAVAVGLVFLLTIITTIGYMIFDLQVNGLSGTQ